MRKKKRNLVVMLLLFSTSMYAQPPSVTLTWTATLNGEHYPPDSVVVTNQANERAVFYYPDTTLVWTNTHVVKPNMPEEAAGLKVFPNPFTGKAQAEFSLAQPENVKLAVFDMLGREIVHSSSALEQGKHVFKLHLPQGMYNLQLQTAAGTQSARLLCEKGGDIVL